MFLSFLLCRIFGCGTAFRWWVWRFWPLERPFLIWSHRSSWHVKDSVTWPFLLQLDPISSTSASGESVSHFFFVGLLLVGPKGGGFLFAVCVCVAGLVCFSAPVIWKADRWKRTDRLPVQCWSIAADAGHVDDGLSALWYLTTSKEETWRCVAEPTHTTKSQTFGPFFGLFLSLFRCNWVCQADTDESALFSPSAGHWNSGNPRSSICGRRWYFICHRLVGQTSSIDFQSICWAAQLPVSVRGWSVCY